MIRLRQSYPLFLVQVGQSYAVVKIGVQCTRNFMCLNYTICFSFLVVSLWQ